MSLFVDGNNGKFDVTSDPGGNPPSDWNITKHPDARVTQETDNPIEGDGSMRIVSNDPFNDDYALAFSNQGSVGTDGQRIILNDFINIDFSVDFTIELRHHLSSYDGNFPYLLRVIHENGGQFGLGYQSSNRLRFFWQKQASGDFNSKFENINDIITISQFNHIVVSFNWGNWVRLYLNGTLIAEELINTSIFGDLTNLDICSLFSGFDNNGYNPTGYARGFRIFSGKAATPTEVNSLYNSSRKDIQSIPGTLSSFLVREFRLNQEQGRSAIESANKDALLSDSYTDSDVQFGGGAWVDVSGIG